MVKELRLNIGATNWYKDETDGYEKIRNCGVIELDENNRIINHEGLWMECEDLFTNLDTGNKITYLKIDPQKLVECMTENTKKQMLKLLINELGDF